MNLKNKAAVVTGGSRGIGRAVAEAFLREGARVVVAARTGRELSRTVRELAPQGEIVGVQADVGRAAGVGELVRRAVDAFGVIDILVNAAGSQQPIGPFLETDIEEWARNVRTNLLGTARCCRAALPHMIRRRRGKIINFSGGGANSSRPNFSAYGISKAAVVRLTEILADELASFGIQVNAVSPGTIRTRMIDEIIAGGPERSGREYEILRSKAESGEGFDSVEGAVGLVVFLASEASGGMTGRVLSAVWDPWREWAKSGPPELGRNDYVLRRIDGRTFIERKAGE